MQNNGMTSSKYSTTNKYQPRILYPAKISLKNEDKTKIFVALNKEKMNEFITRRPILLDY